MATNYFNTNTINEQKTTQSLPAFIQEHNGNYVVSKPLNKTEIIDLAKHVIANQFQRGEEITTTKSCKDYFLFTLVTVRRNASGKSC